MSVTAPHPGSAVSTEQVVELRGELDVATVGALTALLDRAIDGGQADLVVDLGAVSFLDAATIGVLVRARNRLNAGSRSLTLRRPGSCARRLLDVCGLLDMAEPDQLPDAVPASVDGTTAPAPDLDLASRPAHDPWGEAVAAFLADLLDRRGTGGPVPGPGTGPRVAPALPTEFADLPRAAARALVRVTRPPSQTDVVYPSVAKALHDVVIVEVLADRLADRIGPTADLDSIANLVATTVDYFADLAATRYEGSPVTHGVVIAADGRGVDPIDPPVVYPGLLPTRKRTPLLFDGTESVLVVAPTGVALGGFGREALPPGRAEDSGVELFEEVAGLDGALTAAASAAFHGVGFYLRPDRNLWVFENGASLFIRRTGKWRSIAIQTFVSALCTWGLTDERTARRLAVAAIRLSVQGKGAVLAIAPDAAALDHHLEPVGAGPGAPRSAVDDDLSRLIPHGRPLSSSFLARLARIDGATIIDRAGRLLAYSTIVRSTPSGGEGARTAAARSLSSCADVAISVSQDGPITVFVDGAAVLDLL